MVVCRIAGSETLAHSTEEDAYLVKDRLRAALTQASVYAKKQVGAAWGRNQANTIGQKDTIQPKFFMLENRAFSAAVPPLPLQRSPSCKHSDVSTEMFPCVDCLVKMFDCFSRSMPRRRSSTIFSRPSTARAGDCRVLASGNSAYASYVRGYVRSSPEVGRDKMVPKEIAHTRETRISCSKIFKLVKPGNCTECGYLAHPIQCVVSATLPRSASDRTVLFEFLQLFCVPRRTCSAAASTTARPAGPCCTRPSSSSSTEKCFCHSCT